MAYATTQAIREAAGLQSRIENETPTGPVDGTNRAFAVKRKPIVDATYDEVVNADDIIVTVNGTAVQLTHIDGPSGTFSTALAPPAGAVVRVTYHFSPLTQAYMNGKQEEADSWVNMKLTACNITVPLSPTPAIISTVAELYASGVILYKDWGNRSNTEYTTKDGEMKISQARKLLDEYCASNKTQLQSTINAQSAVAAASDPDVFPRQHMDGSRPPHELDDDWFWNRR